MESNILMFFARTIDLVGKVLVSYMAVRVHHRVMKEHKIDESVFQVMKSEQNLGYIGIGLLAAAYLIESYVFLI